jgi:hypothetical protein
MRARGGKGDAMSEPEGRPSIWIGACLAFVSLGELLIGVWALFLPKSFYADFPLSGREWVSTLGPYDEHLVRDVGELNLAFGALLAFAAVLLDRRLVQVSLVAYLVYTVPHFFFHLTQTHAFSVADNLAQLVSLGLQVVLPVVILFGLGLRGSSGSQEI